MSRRECDCRDVAQIFNLLYRRISFGRPLEVTRVPGILDVCGLQVRDPADYKSALPQVLPGIWIAPGYTREDSILQSRVDLRARLAMMRAIRIQTNARGETKWEIQYEQWRNSTSGGSSF